jgi:hypothetical protein
MLRDVPGQQFVDAVGPVIRNVRKHEFQVDAWIDVVQFARSCRIPDYAESSVIAVANERRRIVLCGVTQFTFGIVLVLDQSESRNVSNWPRARYRTACPL